MDKIRLLQVPKDQILGVGITLLRRMIGNERTDRFFDMFVHPTSDWQFLSAIDLKNLTVYDVGAHVGRLTLLFSEAVGIGGRVIAFEPNPETFRSLQARVKSKGNVELHNVALGSHDECLSLVSSAFSNATGSLNHSIQDSFKVGLHRTWTVKVRRLDSFNGLPKPDLVKIDVEGFELDVLNGMQQTIKLYRPRIMVEIHGLNPKEKYVKASVIVHLLKGFGYDCLHIESGQSLTQQVPYPIEGHVYAQLGSDNSWGFHLFYSPIVIMVGGADHTIMNVS